jgi:hypothetical protein
LSRSPIEAYLAATFLRHRSLRAPAGGLRMRWPRAPSWQVVPTVGPRSNAWRQSSVATTRCGCSPTLSACAVTALPLLGFTETWSRPRVFGHRTRCLRTSCVVSLRLLLVSGRALPSTSRGSPLPVTLRLGEGALAFEQDGRNQPRLLATASSTSVLSGLPAPSRRARSRSGDRHPHPPRRKRSSRRASDKRAEHPGKRRLG